VGDGGRVEKGDAKNAWVFALECGGDGSDDTEISENVDDDDELRNERRDWDEPEWDEDIDDGGEGCNANCIVAVDKIQRSTTLVFNLRPTCNSNLRNSVLT